MLLQAIDDILQKYYKALMTVVCLGLLCGHVVPVVSSFTLFHLFLAITVVLAFLYRATMPRMFYIIAGYFLLYGIWTWTASIIWGDAITAKETIKFFSIPVLLIALLRVMLVYPRKMLEVVFYVSIVYLLTMTAMGYVEHFSGWHLPTSVSYQATNEELRQATGLCYNPNDYSVLLVMAALYIFAFSSQFLTKKWIISSLAAIAVCIPLMLWNGCRTGLGVLALAILFYFVSQIKKRKLSIAITIAALVAAGVAITFNHGILGPRINLYGTSITSLYDSYGIGFGINGDKLYLSNLDNYNITRGLTNAHSHLLQILFTSGLPIFLLYCLMIVWVTRCAGLLGRNLFWLSPILYLLLLFCPSSSLYLWGHYIFFCAYICYAAYALDNKNKHNRDAEFRTYRGGRIYCPTTSESNC